MNSNEQETIRLCQSGQTEHFTALYEIYVEKIYKFLYFRTFHKATAEDLTSEVFYKALDKINSFDSKKGQFSTWLYQIAKNSLTDHFRKNREHLDIEAAWDISSTESISNDTENRIALETVQKYLSGLDPRQRQIVIMRVWDGLSYKEISELLKISEANAKMIFSRTLNKLQADIGISIITIILVLINYNQQL
ncbi:MAG: sigma-70 family RNA polymerase sigma factor [Candidatus Doudnabacteria bacterium]|nr:sigma-70 family RNA polymerase sigma factor [Candidatus Doudnabacteria bacterium]